MFPFNGSYEVFIVTSVYIELVIWDSGVGQ